MKLVHLLLFLLFAAAASAAYFMLLADPPEQILRSTTPPATSRIPKTVSTEAITIIPETNMIPVEDDDPEVPLEDPGIVLEERDDAMLFEIDALQSTPFDDAVTRPFD